MTEHENLMSLLSSGMTSAVEMAEKSTVLVNARHRIPGSGIVFAKDLILTADHVVERDDEISVVDLDGKEIPVTVAGRDPGSDLALLRLSEPIARPAELAQQEAQVGLLVLALGRPSLQGVEASIGIVSAVGGPIRTGRGGLLERYIRTDTTPYPGFSGGPLVTFDGNVIGLNTSGFGHGVPLTIPASLAWRVAGVLAEHGHIRRGYLGVRSQQVKITAAQQEVLGRQQQMGLLIISVEDDSPAGQGGMLVGDILVGIGKMDVSDPDELFSALSGVEVGQPTPVSVLRAGQPVTLTVTVGERQ
jgi:S1-C subfamily serine protease